MNRLHTLLIGAALITGGSALASAQVVQQVAFHDHDRDRDRDRDHDRDDRYRNNYRYREYRRGDGDHDRDDRYYVRRYDRDDYGRGYYVNDRRWDGRRWWFWDGYRWR